MKRRRREAGEDWDLADESKDCLHLRRVGGDEEWGWPREDGPEGEEERQAKLKLGSIVMVNP